MEKQHKPEEVSEEPPETKGKFKCRACEKNFVSKKVLEKHRKTKEHKQNEKLYRESHKIEVFEKESSDQWAEIGNMIIRLRHIDRSKVQQETCTECEKKFSSVQLLKSHALEQHGAINYMQLSEQIKTQSVNMFKKYVKFQFGDDVYYQAML